jgi:hypothetical protein
MHGLANIKEDVKFEIMGEYKNGFLIHVQKSAER